MDRQNFVFLSFLLKDLHKNVYVTDRKVELLGCMYDDGVVVVVAHSVWTRNASGEAVTLSFSLSFSHFSITVVLLFSLFPVVHLYRFLFFLFFVSFTTADSRTSKGGAYHYTYISLPGRLFVLYSFLSMQGKTAACRVQRLVVIWQLHLIKNRTERKMRRTKRNFSLALLLFLL